MKKKLDFWVKIRKITQIKTGYDTSEADFASYDILNKV
jgi:hypothetical protein